MSLIVVAGGKSAAGVTTTATALAAVWPRPAVLADCDPSGGDVAIRLRQADGQWLARDRGLVGLAADARLGTGTLDVAAQLQAGLGGLPVLVGVESGAQALKIGGLWPAIGTALASLPDTDVIADCGRLFPGLPSEHLVARAARVVLVTRATVEAVAHLRHAFEQVRDLPRADGSRPVEPIVAVIAAPETLRRDVQQVGVAVAAGRHPELDVVGLDLDPAAAAGLSGVPTRGLDRSALVTAARRIAAELYASLSRREDPSPLGSPVAPDAVKVG